MTPSISIQKLSKRYSIRKASQGRFGTDLADDMLHVLGRLARGKLPRFEMEDFWALRDVELDFQPGDIVGLLGRNGAGKSTLLKILARIVRPSSGEAILRGRVGALLEVGTGFHPDLTGRENIYLAGAILGMGRAEIRTKFDEIVEFSEIEGFLDTQVKRYSSGMYTRLAFSVAAHLDTDVLLVDEVLAVGDVTFQRKCLGKMDSIARQGKTIVFVSHHTPSIQRLCRTAVFLQRGEVVEHGPVEQVVATYQRAVGGNQSDCIWSLNDMADWKDDLFVPLELSLRTLDGALVDGPVSNDMPLQVRIEFELLARERGFRLLYAVSTEDGTSLWRSCNADAELDHPEALEPGRHVATTIIPGNTFNSGRFRLEVHAFEECRRPIVDRGAFAPNVVFEISGLRGPGPVYPLYCQGVLAPVHPWTISPLQ